MFLGGRVDPLGSWFPGRWCSGFPATPRTPPFRWLADIADFGGPKSPPVAPVLVAVVGQVCERHQEDHGAQQSAGKANFHLVRSSRTVRL